MKNRSQHFRDIETFLLRHYIETKKIAGCQVAICHKGNIAFFSSLGHMDFQRGANMRDDAIFRIYSMTKPITSVALLMLMERGLLKLDDPVSAFIPEWKDHQVYVSGSGENMVTEPPQRAVTIKDLLCHTGGITYGTALDEFAPQDRHPVTAEYVRHGVNPRDTTLRTFVKKLGKVPLRYQPGQRWMYSHSTDVCAALVEIISNKSFDQFLEEELFTPLGMVDTSFSIPGQKIDRFTACYRFDKQSNFKLLDDPHDSVYANRPAFLSGGGGLISTTHDYLRFCEMLRRKGELDGVRILLPNTVDLMHQNHLQNGQDLASMAIGLFSESKYSGIGFGLGFACVIDKHLAQSVVDTDWYWGGAASTLFWVDDVHELSVVFMSQLLPSSTFDFRTPLKQLVYQAIV